MVQAVEEVEVVLEEVGVAVDQWEEVHHTVGEIWEADKVTLANKFQIFYKLNCHAAIHQTTTEY